MTQIRPHQSDLTLQAMLYSNGIINGMCQVAQRVTAPSLSTTSQYGTVDRFRVHATGTAVNAGTIAQDNAASPGTSGYALKVAGATITGTGIVFIKYRMEAKDALAYKNGIASFGCKVRHDVGSGINYTITVRKPTTTTDDFSAVTDIQVGSAVSVATATNQTLSLEAVSLGDCSKGIEIEVKIECGAVTTKNFWLTEFQFNPGYRTLAFLARSFVTELAACQRYYEKSYPYADAPGTTYAQIYMNSANFRDNGGANLVCGASDRFEVRKRVAPTMSWYNPITGAGTTHAAAGGNTGTSYTSLTFNFGGETHCVFGVTTTGSDFHVGSCWVASAEL